MGGPRPLLPPAQVPRAHRGSNPNSSMLQRRLCLALPNRQKLRKPSCAIALDSSLAQLPPALIQRAQHAVLLVDIYSDVVHENSFLSSSSLRTGMLLSCYLTPILPSQTFSLAQDWHGISRKSLPGIVCAYALAI